MIRKIEQQKISFFFFLLDFLSFRKSFSFFLAPSKSTLLSALFLVSWKPVIDHVWAFTIYQLNWVTIPGSIKKIYRLHKKKKPSKKCCLNTKKRISHVFRNICDSFTVKAPEVQLLKQIFYAVFVLNTYVQRLVIPETLWRQQYYWRQQTAYHSYKQFFWYSEPQKKKKKNVVF